MNIASVLMPAAAAGVGAFLGNKYRGRVGLGVGALSGAALGVVVAHLMGDTPGNRIETVHGRGYLIHVPERSSGKYLAYFHGNGARIDDLWDTIAALDKAKEPRVIVIPQLDPHGGMPIQDLIDVLDRLGVKELDVLAHSGGYVSAAALLRSHKKTIRNVGLLDALYGDLDAFEQFVKSDTSNLFVDIYGNTTTNLSQAMMAHLGGNPKARFAVSAVAHGRVPAEYGAGVLDAFSSSW